MEKKISFIRSLREESEFIDGDNTRRKNETTIYKNKKPIIMEEAGRRRICGIRELMPYFQNAAEMITELMGSDRR